MTSSMSKFTRRGLGALLLSLPLAGSIARIGLANTQPIETRLAAALADMVLPYQPSQLALLHFTAKSVGKLEAVVELDWPQGMRRRLFAANETDDEAALRNLIRDIRVYFASLA